MSQKEDGWETKEKGLSEILFKMTMLPNSKLKMYKRENYRSKFLINTGANIANKVLARQAQLNPKTSYTVIK